jgi:hypothetical protein
VREGGDLHGLDVNLFGFQLKNSFLDLLESIFAFSSLSKSGVSLVNLCRSSRCAAAEAAVLIFPVRVPVLISLLQEFFPVEFCSGEAVSRFLGPLKQTRSKAFRFPADFLHPACPVRPVLAQSGPSVLAPRKATDCALPAVSPAHTQGYSPAPELIQS